MPRFQQFEQSQNVWPAGLVTNPPGSGMRTSSGTVSGVGGSTLTPVPGSCALPMNPRAGQPGVNDPYFASSADRNAWIASNPTCTPPPPFLPDSAPTAPPAPTTGTIQFTLSASSGSLPSDLAVTVDGVTVPASGPPSSTGEIAYPANGLSAGAHTIKITGTGVQFAGQVNAVAGATIGMPIQLAVTPPGTTPGATTQPTVQPPSVPVIAPPVPQVPTTVVVTPSSGPSWGTLLLAAVIAGGIGWVVSQSGKHPEPHP